ncbi:uncharacterized protein N7446_010725 [Penicillium canescens]|uniref:Uncharacterized protein n=1 Tax=Penicillium canescens TaxID=5083 RepID=A0AAD6N823_PENCN|nr:uncharacterized protein N7446_010725 [Penicillium canescens]KAJ6041387.1 hypothetical protein N7460_006777 [Penicillium canescens]KAJ6050616.1 hypothetical protein N7446_010725 [Penicillium canescens]KAJ6065837.1 hypothetical protein N7444_001490 [Penicillium canescens]
MSPFEHSTTFGNFGVPASSLIHDNPLGIATQTSSPENSETRHSTQDGDLKAVETTGQPETKKVSNILGNSAGQDEPEKDDNPEGSSKHQFQISRKDNFYVDPRLIGHFFHECFALAALAVYWIGWVVCALGYLILRTLRQGGQHGPLNIPPPPDGDNTPIRTPGS